MGSKFLIFAFILSILYVNIDIIFHGLEGRGAIFKLLFMYKSIRNWTFQIAISPLLEHLWKPWNQKKNFISLLLFLFYFLFPSEKSWSNPILQGFEYSGASLRLLDLFHMYMYITSYVHLPVYACLIRGLGGAWSCELNLWWISFKINIFECVLIYYWYDFEGHRTLLMDIHSLFSLILKKKREKKHTWNNGQYRTQITWTLHQLQIYRPTSCEGAFFLRIL